jgi:tellurite resistance protein
VTTNHWKPASESAARVLALMVSANGHIDPRELAVLDELGAFARLGIGRERFLVLARECLREVGSSLAECSWLRLREQAYIDRLLDAVDDPQQRLLVCRLASAAITADGRVSGDERLVYDHVLSRWRIGREAVTEAILHDAHRPHDGARPIG